jgi:hypothetical protein
MKKLLLLSASCLILFSACKKDSNEGVERSSNEKTYPVSINLSGFKTSLTTMSTAKQTLDGPISPADAHIDKIMYLIYDSQGNQVSRMEQYAANANKIYRIINDKRVLMNSSNAFGAITDTLKAGIYTMVTTAGGLYANFNSVVTVSSSNGEVPSAVPGYYVSSTLADAKFYTNPQGGTGNAFYYKGQLTVGDNTPPTPVTLSRIVGMIELVFEDQLPASARMLSVTVGGEKSYYRVNTNTPEGTYDNSYNMAISGYGLPDDFRVHHSIYIQNTATPVDLTVTVYDDAQKVLGHKTITNIPVTANQKTIVTGKMFNPASGNSSFIYRVWGTALPVVN